MNKVFLSIGGNLGNRFENILKTEKIISEKIGKIIFSSAVYETAPWGFEHENNFYNKVLCIETKLSAEKILEIALAIEKKLGRIRTEKKILARTMDIDILFYNNEIIETEVLIVPHPQIHLRKFVLVPLAEIASELEHPVFRKSVAHLLIECKDILDVKRL